MGWPLRATWATTTATGRYELSPEHAQVLAVEGGPVFLGGGYQGFAAMLQPLESVVRAFRTGGGARQEEYGAEWWSSMERFTNGWFENLLLQVWIPSMPEVERSSGRCDYADVGCGSGRALVKLARRSRVALHGYDIFGPRSSGPHPPRKRLDDR